MSDDATPVCQVGLDFELLFRAAPAGSVVTDSRHIILDVNDAFLTWTGLRRDNLVGTSFMQLLSVGDRILFSTHTQPLLVLNGWVPETAVTVLGRDRSPLSAAFTASHLGSDPQVTMFVVGPRRERSFEEAQLISAIHRAEDSDARRQAAEANLERQTNFDSLTGLLTRSGLIADFTNTITVARAECSIAAYWVGLDHFRVINESLGQTAGDDILRVIAQRLREEFGHDVLVARAGGDEFVVTMAERASERVAQRLLSLIAEPVSVDGLDIVISASIGIAASELGTGASVAGEARSVIETLLRNAAMASHEAKATGRNRWARVTTTRDDSAINEIQLLGELRTAIADNQLRLEYQPQLDLRTGELHGVEALLRWDHPARGLVPPNAFIAVAERTGLIGELGAWVCREAVSQATELNQGDEPGSVQMSVNVSARQLSDAHFASTVESLLMSTSLSPAVLTLEITETSVITDAPQARENLHRLHDEGFRLSIDDFGTGHGGFSYLYDFPIDEIKIDRSFVNGLLTSPEASAIVTSCIEVAHALDVTVVAEGVETAAQLERLDELGCDIAQGFYYARPLRIEALRDFIRT